MAHKRFQLEPQTLKLLQVIDSTEDEDKRQQAIRELSQQGGMNSARTLIETYERCMWRSTKFAIIQALGRVGHERAIEFLCLIAADTGDFGLAAEAILALGNSDDPVAGEFLAAILRTPNHPLLREALTAVANLNFFPCEAEISEIFNDKKSDAPQAVRQNAIIAAGLKGYRSFLPAITSIVESGVAGPLFNTALMALGRIGNASSLSFLEKLDTRFRAFAHQLKLGAVEHLRIVKGYTIEDSVGLALTARSSAAMRQAWVLLRNFPEESAREALQILAAEGSPGFHALERCSFFHLKSLKSDLQFLAKHQSEIPNEIFAALGRMHAQNASRDSVLQELRQLGAEFLVKFLSLVRVDRGWEELLEMVANSKSPAAIRNDALNGLASQALMHGFDPHLIETIGKRLIRLIEAEADPGLRGRMIRALGQLRYLGPDAVNLLRDRIKSGEDSDAAYSALARCGSEESSKIITKRLRQIVGSATSEPEVRAAVRALARSQVVGDVSCLAQLPSHLLEDMKIAVLKILSAGVAVDLTHFVAEALKSADFQAKVLAVTASRFHQNSEIAEQLFQCLRHRNQSIAVRALDSIATSYGAAEHLRLLDFLLERPGDEEIYKKVFKSLTPRMGESYRDVISRLDVLIAERKGVMADRDMVQAALNLRDNLVVINAAVEAGHSAKRNTTLTEIDEHAIDETLVRNLRGFQKYSPTIKSVLRSGEVTWQHPELFDARVDKSTVLVQYVKAVDLLLQEKIGSQMFLGQGSEFLLKMQSRVIHLELDEDQPFDSQLVSALDCSMYFSRDSFPTHKLTTICKSIMTGQIMKEQYRMVDGLRAWAILLLIFGRPFKFRGKNLEPLFPLVKPSNDSVCRIARAMNDLQDARNRAAHRGTVLEKDNIKELRDLSAALLNDLEVHLPGSSASS